MAINQPPITDQTVLDAWMLEVTRELNSGTGVASVAPPTTPSSTSLINRVDTNGILRLSQAGVLSNAPVVTTVNNQAPISGNVNVTGSGATMATIGQNDYSLTIPDPGGTTLPTASYQFTLAGTTIPEAHMVFLGGFRLCESTSTTTRDYSISGNTITLTRTSRDLIGLDLILTVFSATLS